mmetsp:Transcript_15257/g.36121  ORF Transcript_15257/g.36121 Transcript_15257/m.36121 type:complete len:85 (+) Transcript_15257:1-255(+)
MSGMFAHAWAFNQPLSWETSSVTNFEVIFEAHFACDLRPDSSLAFPCTLHARSPRHRSSSPPPGPHLAPHRMSPLDSAGRTLLV